MIQILVRPRLTIDAQFVPIDTLTHLPIRASSWDFAINWNENERPKFLRVNAITVQRWHLHEIKEQGQYLFSLPPMIRGLTRIEVESFYGASLIKIVEVITGYQLPRLYLKEIIEWNRDFNRTLAVFPGQTGDIAVLDLITSELFKTSSDEVSAYQEEDIPAEKRSELAELFEKVLRTPRSRLIDDNFLVAPGEIRRITPTTIDYFIQHPETWYSRSSTMSKLEPVKLLDERTIENFDVYENRFVLHFLEKLDELLHGLIHRYTQSVNHLAQQIPESEIQANYGWNVDDNRLSQLRTQENEVRKSLNGFKRLQTVVRQVKSGSLFTNVRPLSRPPKANTTLSMHPVYGRLYRLYEEVIRQTFSQKQLNWLDEAKRADLLGIYQQYCLMMVIQALKESRFELTESSMISPSVFDNSAKNTPDSKNWQLRFTHQLYQDTEIYRGPIVKIIYVGSPKYECLRGTLRLEFEFNSNLRTATETIGKEYVWLIPDITWWGATKGENKAVASNEKQAALQEMYTQLQAIYTLLVPVKKSESNKRGRRATQVPDEIATPNLTVLLLHPTPPPDFDNKLGYQYLRLLLNQGDNFVTDEDYASFGGYKIGCLPVYLAGGSSFRSLLRLKRLIRIHLFRAGLENLCCQCSQKARGYQEKNGQRHYECSNSSCGLRWGEVKCKHCGNRYVKMTTPRAAVKKHNISFENDITDSMAIVNSETLEGRLTASSACENIDRAGDFWAICPYCGHCEKETSTGRCRRCQERAS